MCRFGHMKTDSGGANNTHLEPFQNIIHLEHRIVRITKKNAHLIKGALSVIIVIFCYP
jgi:hypothetical protein